MPDPDTLTAAAERARQAGNDELAERLTRAVEFGAAGTMLSAADLEVLMSAPIPAVDRGGLARLIDDEINAVHNANQAPDADGEDLRSEGEIAVDALLSAGLVTTPGRTSPEVRRRVRDILEAAYDAIDPDVDLRHDGAVNDLISAGLVTETTPPQDRAKLAAIAHGPQVPLAPVAGIPSPWQAVEDALDRLIAAGLVTGQAAVAATLRAVVAGLRDDGAVGSPDWRDAYQQAANDWELLAEEVERTGATADLLQVARDAMRRDPTTEGVVAAVTTVVQVDRENRTRQEERT